jgi:hypothetical protein
VNVCPRGSVSLFVDDQHHEVAVGGTLTVTPETAGAAPHWRKADDADSAALAVNPEALHWRMRAGDLEVFDLGSGLLAQSDNWRKAGDTSDPADPTSDGRGGTIDPAEQAALLAQAQRDAETSADAVAGETSETESI